MLKMLPFHLEKPATLDEALTLLAAYGSRAQVCAGGTDLIPNLKHMLHQPEVVVHLGRLPNLATITVVNETLRLGALSSLEAVSQHALVLQHAPGLAAAALCVAGPQHRRMGTLGGNICLDTRCLYYNQTHFWREALGFCLKKDGTACHVVAGGRRCVAAACNDTATMLISLGAAVEIATTHGSRTVALEAFYAANGAANTVLEPGELLTAVLVPMVGAPSVRKEGFAKLRLRGAVDFPLLNVGVAWRLVNGLADHVRLTVGAVSSRPVVVGVQHVVGQAVDGRFVEALGQAAYARCKPLTSVAEDVQWRRDMVPVMVQRAVEHAQGLRPPEGLC